jgi:hypothetical protein
MKIIINHSKIVDDVMLGQNLSSQGMGAVVVAPRMRTIIVDDIEQDPVPVDGYIEFEDESKAELVQQILDAHDSEAIQQEREAAEAARIADMLSRHPEALQILTNKIQEELAK